MTIASVRKDTSPNCPFCQYPCKTGSQSVQELPCCDGVIHADCRNEWLDHYNNNRNLNHHNLRCPLCNEALSQVADPLGEGGIEPAGEGGIEPAGEGGIELVVQAETSNSIYSDLTRRVARRVVESFCENFLDQGENGLMVLKRNPDELEFRKFYEESPLNLDPVIFKDYLLASYGLNFWYIVPSGPTGSDETLFSNKTQKRADLRNHLATVFFPGYADRFIEDIDNRLKREQGCVGLEPVPICRCCGIESKPLMICLYLPVAGLAVYLLSLLNT